MIKPTTKTVVATVSTLMAIGMIVSFVNGTDTYYRGHEVARRPRVQTRTATTVPTANYFQTSVLSAGTERKTQKSNNNEQTNSKIQLPKIEIPVAPMIPMSCQEQHLYTYTGKDSNGVFFGSCIPCEMNKFNVQTKSCSL